jgi:histidine ammonia-lyase
VEHALERLAIELNAAQGNPLVSARDGRVFSASVYEVAALSAALDYVRTALMTVYSSASERVVKLLDTPWSGLPTGLLPQGGPDLGLSIHAITAQSLGAEASLLAQPVSFTVLSTAGAEGIEDRASHLPLSARRLSEMVALGEGLVGIELLVAAQAVDARGVGPLGRATGDALRLVRKSIPALAAGDPPPTDVSPIVALIRSRQLG